ncbi:unnamed protein product [Mesocestoides corti]|uniref:STAS domain-containing protein n=1 Tax=Mesocestoides corti TaxID=53468 RepID=A0A0R3U8A3_MESCO|nr:unnamed protein product [Mesocestoides corti]
MNESAENFGRTSYRVNRLTYNQREFIDEFHEIPKGKLTASRIKASLLKIRLRTFGFELFPVFRSLLSFYNLHNFALDVIAGVTMAFFHLPQGMAYGALAGLRPVNGLYASFFPVLAYFFFTTSRHNSFGTFSLAALLFCNPINRITNLYYVPSHSNSSIGMSDDEYNFRLNVAVTLAFSVGILQVIMALLQFGFLVTYLSGPFISGFMCASAFHVVTSQLNSMFGLKRRLFLLQVILSTVLSHFIGFSQRWGVQVVGQIPFGLPAPVVPTFAYFSDLIADIFVIGAVVFAVNAGLVKTYATEFGYDVLDNQELLAVGISNAFASFFQCHTACGALGRTAVVVTIGMTSQIASLISCGLLLLILFFIAPYLEALPQAVLASVVCVALTSTFKKILDLRRLWKVSKVDASIWLVSFLATLTIDIVYGVAIGFIYSLLTVVSRSQYGDRFLLGSARDTDLYSELKRFEELHELDGIKIIRYDGPVYFANVDSFQKTVYRLSGVNPTLAQQQAGKKQLRCRLFLFKSRSGDARKATCPVAADKKDRTDAAPTDSYSTVACEPENDGDMSKSPAKQLRFVILDASGWMFTDTVGMRGLKEVCGGVLLCSLKPGAPAFIFANYL